tara:strand:+ start:3794 stop:4195 length:402 start_codon:yes stop_codon:yes gene_type:complete
MKRSQLKKMLKPLIQECIKEALYEEGLLKNIVSQVVEGYSQGAQPIMEVQRPREPSKQEINESKQIKAQLTETKQKMLKAIGQSSYAGVNVFEGTTPMRSAEPSAGNIMEGVEPRDPGVDISKFFNHKWGKLI